MKTDARFPRLHIVDHPLIQHKLTIMRQKETSTNVFRQLLHEITVLMGYELTRDLPLSHRHIETPIGPMQAPTLAGKKQVIVPVLRAGLGMSDGLLQLMPSARVGHIGMYRDENHRPVEYLVRLPDVTDRLFIICDPMMATGYSAVHAADVLKKRGVAGETIRVLVRRGPPERGGGVPKKHPHICVDVGSLYEKPHGKGYIRPGPGGARERGLWTK